MRCRALAVVAIGALIAAGCTTLVEVSAPNGANHAGYSFPYFDGGGPVLSGDGRYSVFTAPRTATNPTPEAFRRDGKTGKTVRVSSDASGAAVGGDAPVISRDGRYVAFRTTASLASEDHNLDPSRGLTGYDWYVKDMSTAHFELLTFDAGGTQLEPGGPDVLASAFMSATGRYVAFQFVHEQGRSFDSEIYVRDRQAGVTHLVDGGQKLLEGLSGDGLHVGVDDLSLCISFCPPPAPGVHVDDWSAGTTYTIGCGAGGRMPMSDDGRYVAVLQVNQDEGCALGLARYDRSRAAPPVMFNPEIPLTQGGGQPQLASATMSVDGNRGGFSLDRDLVAGDTNHHTDVYVGDLAGHAFGVASRTADDHPGDGDSINPWLSPDGSLVQFDTQATNLVADDTDGQNDTVLTPAIRPTLDRISSSSQPLVRGGSARIVAFGTGLSPDLAVALSGDGVSVRNVSVVDPTEVLFTVDVATTAPTGARTVTVTDPGPYGSASGACAGCLTVVAGG